MTQLVTVLQIYNVCVCVCVPRSRSVGGLGRMWANSCSQSRVGEARGRHRLSTVIQPLRQSAGEVVDLTVDEDGKPAPYFCPKWGSNTHNGGCATN